MNHLTQIRKKLEEAGAEAILLTDEKNQRYARFPVYRRLCVYRA